MNTRLKSRLLCKEPLNNRSITELPGVGPTTGKRLSDNGYKEILDIYNMFKKYKNNKLGFQKWMKNVCNGKLSQSEDCYNFFQLWEIQFGEGENSTKNPEKSTQKNVKFSDTKTKPGAVKKRKLSVQFEKAKPNMDTYEEEFEECDQEIIPSQKQEMHDPLKDFFISKMHVVKTLPFNLQIKVKKSISKIIFEAENEALENETEPVTGPSTSATVNGAPRRSRSTEELLKNLEDLQ